MSETSYAGSADIELQKYLDSVEGKLSVLQNRLQELAAVSIDSEWIKVLVDLGSGAVKVITDISRAAGSLNIAFGLLAGVATTAFGAGFVDFKKGEEGLGGFSRFISDYKKVFDARKKGIQFEGRDESILTLDAAQDKNVKAYDYITEKWEGLDEFFDSLSSSSQDKIQDLWDGIKQGSDATVQDLIDKFPEAASKSLLDAQNNVEKGVNTIKDIALTGASMLVNGILDFGISWVVSKVASGLVDMAKNIIFHYDVLQQKGQEAAENIKDIYGTIEAKSQEISNLAVEIHVKDAETNKVSKNLEGIAARYVELKKGVNELDNSNRSLSNEKYQEYLDICNKIAEQSPALVERYDEQRNAILNIGNTAEECALSLKNMFDISIEGSHADLGENVDIFLDSAVSKVNKLQGDLDSLNFDGALAKYNNLTKMLGASNFEFSDTDTGRIILPSYSPEYVDILKDVLSEYYSGLNVKVDNLAFGHEGELEEISVKGLAELDPRLQEEIYRTWISRIHESIGDTLSLKEANLEEIESIANADAAQIADTYARATNYIGQYLETSKTFTEFSDSIQSAIMAGIQFNDETAKIYTDKYNKDFVSFIYGEVITPINNLTLPQINLLDKLLNLDYTKNDLTVEQISNQFRSTFESIFGDNADNMLSYFNVSPMIDNWEKQQQFIFDSLQDNVLVKDRNGNVTQKGLTDEQQALITGMQPEDVEAAYELLQSRTFKSFDKFLEALEKKRHDIPKDGLLSTILSNEGFANKRENVEKNLSAIQTAINSLADSGDRLSGEAFIALRDVMKDTDFGDYSKAAISEVGIQQLSSYIGLLYDEAKAANLTDEALEDLNDYVQNLIISYKDFSVSAEDVIDKFTSVSLSVKGGGAYADVSKFQQEFEKELGDKDDRQILYYLTLDPTHATWSTEEWRRQYDNARVNWELILDLDEFNKAVALADATLTRIKGEAENAQAKVEEKNRKGDFDTTAELDVQINASKAEIKRIKEQMFEIYDPSHELTKAIDKALKEGDQNAYQVAVEARLTEAGDLRGQLMRANKELEDLEFDKLTLPLTIIDNTTLDDLKDEYDNVLKPALEAYGDSVEIDSGLYDNLMSNLSDQVTQNQNKINLIDSLFDLGLSAEFEEELETMRADIVREMTEAQTQINTYSSDSLLGNDRIQIARLKGDKSAVQTLQQTRGTEMREVDYEILNSYNTQISALYTHMIDTSAQKWQELSDSVSGDITKLSAEQQVEYEKWYAEWTDAITARAEFDEEITKNNESIELLPLTRLEEQLENLKGDAEKLETIVEDIKSEKGILAVPDEQLNLLASNYQKQFEMAAELEKRYTKLYMNTPKNSPQRAEYKSKANNYANSLIGMQNSIDSYLKDIDSKSIESLTLQMTMLEYKADEVAESIENAKRPLLEKDYQQALETNAERLKNLGDQEAYWLEQMEGLSETDKNYQEYKSNLESIHGQMRNLIKDQEAYNKALKNLPYEHVNNQLEIYDNAIAKLQKDMELVLTQGGEKTNENYYNPLIENYEGAIASATEGFKKAQEDIKEAMKLPQGSDVFNLDAMLQLTPSLDNPSDFKKNVIDVLSPTGVDTAEIDFTAVKDAVALSDEYYGQMVSNQINLTNTQNEQSELRLQQLERELAGYESTVTTQERLNEEARATAGGIAEANLINTTQAYDDAIETLTDLQNELEILKTVHENDADGGQTYIDQLETITSKLSDLNQKKFQLKLEFDKQSLTNLQNEMEDLTTLYGNLQRDLESGLSSKSQEQIYNSQIGIATQQYSNARATAESYQALMANLIEDYSDGLFEGQEVGTQDYLNTDLWREYEKALDEANDSAVEYVKTILELREAILSLPENRMNSLIESNDARNSADRARLDYTKDRGGIVTSADYADILNRDASTIKAQEQILAERREELAKIEADIEEKDRNSDVITQADLTKRAEKALAVYQAESELYSAMQNLSEDQKAANEALLAEYNERTRVIEAQKVVLSNQAIIDDAAGVTRTNVQIGADLTLSRDSLDSIQQQIRELEAGGVSMIEAATPEEAQTIFEETLAGLRTAEAQALGDIYKYTKEDLEAGAQGAYDLLDNYNRAVKKTSDQMDDLKREGSEIPDYLFDVKISGIENARQQLIWLESYFESLILSYGDEHPEWAKGWKTTIEDIREQLRNLGIDIETTEEDKAAKAMTALTNQLDDLKRKGEDLQETLNNTSLAKTSEMYKNAIANAIEQQTNLNSQIAEVQAEMANVQDPNSEKYTTLKAQLNSLTDEYDALTESIKSWGQAINNLTLDSMIKAIDEYAKEIEKVEKSQNNATSLGHIMTEQDYSTLVDMYKHEAELAKTAYEEAWSGLTVIPFTNFTVSGLQVGSEDYVKAVADAEGFQESYLDWMFKADTTAHEKEFLPITNLKSELSELELVGEAIQREFDAITEAGNDVSDDDYGRMTTNLEDQRTKLEELRDVYQDLYLSHKDDSFGAELLSGINEVDGKLRSIATKEIEIGLKIDNRELVNLQEDFGYLEREAQSLQAALSDPYSTTKSAEEILTGIVSNGRAQLSNLRDQANEYQESMEKIKLENPDDYLNNDKYIEAAIGLSNVNSNIREVAKSIREAGEALRNLPYEKLDALINARRTTIDLNASRRELTEATGGVVTSADYAGDISAMRGNIGTLTTELNQREQDMLGRQARVNFVLQNPDLEDSNLDKALEDYNQAVEDFNRAKIAVNNAEKELAQTEKEANQANQDAYASRITVLENYRQSIASEREALEAMGKTRTASDITLDISLAEGVKEQLQKQLDDLDANHANMDLAEYTSARLALTKEIHSEEVAIATLQKELIEKPLDGPQKALEALKRTNAEIQRMISSYENLDKEIPDNILADKLLNIEGQISQESARKSQLQGLIDTFKPLFGEGFIDLMGWRNDISEAEDALVELSQEKIDTQNMIDDKPLVHLGYELDVLKRKHQEFINLLETGAVPKTPENYRIAIKDAVQEQENLANQIQLTKEKQKEYTINDPAYQTLQNTIDSLVDSYDSLTDSIVEWGDAIKNSPLNAAIAALEDYEKHLNRTIADQNNFASLGGRLTTEDYSKRIAGYRAASRDAYEIAQTYARKADQPFISEEDRKEAIAQYEANMETYRQYLQDIKETTWEMVQLPVRDLRIQQKDIQRVFNNIELTISELGRSGMEATDGLLLAEIDTIDQEMANLSEQRAKYEAYKGWAEHQGLDDKVDEMQEQIDTIDTDLDSLANKKREINLTIDRRPIVNAENAIKRLESEAAILKNTLETLEVDDSRRDPLLRALEANEKRRQSYIRNEINLYNAELERISNETNGAATYFNNEDFRAAQDAIDSLTLSFDQSTASILEYQRAIRNIPLENLKNEIDKLNGERGNVASANAVRQALGGTENFAALLGIDTDINETAQNLVDEAYNAMEDAKQKWKNREGKIGEDIAKANYDQARDEYIAALDQANNSEAQYINTRLSAARTPVDDLIAQMEKINVKAEDTQHAIDAMTSIGLTGTEEQYRAMLNYSQSRINTINQERTSLEAYKDVAIELIHEYNTNHPDNPLSLNNNPFLNGIESELEQLDGDTQTYLQNILDSTLMLNGGIELNALQLVRSQLERESNAIGNEISLAESRGVTPSLPLYEKIAKITSQELDTLKQTREQLIRQRESVKDNVSQYETLSGEIDSIDSQINQATINFENYNKQIVRYARNYATQLSELVNSAISESVSGSGVSADTIDNLKAKFSELEEAYELDLSSLFYESAEGVKVNSDALEGLVKIQKRSYGRELLNRIEEANRAVQENAKSIAYNKNLILESDREQMISSRNLLSQYKQELAGFVAIMNSIEEANSMYAQWQNAQSTANKSDKYDNILNSFAEVEKRINQGLTTDEDQAFIRMISNIGANTAEEFYRMTPILAQYFTKNMDGMQRFLDKLVMEGFATVEDGIYSLENIDLGDVASALGISEELTKVLFDKLGESGIDVTITSSGIDAYVQAQEKQEEYLQALSNLIAAQERNDLDATAYWSNEVKRLRGEIDTLKNYDGGMLINESDFNVAMSQIKALQAKLGSDPLIDDEEIIAQINRIADAAGIKVSEDGTHILTTSLQEANDNLLSMVNEMGKAVEEVPIKVELTQESLQNMSEMKLDKEGIADQVQEALDARTFTVNVEVDKEGELSENGKKYNDLMTSFANQKYGNIDLNNRQVMQLDDDTIATVLGSWDNTFKVNDQNVSVAFSPLLQTDNGVVQLNRDTLYDYIQRLLDMSTTEEGFDYDLFLNLDQRGMYYQDVMDETGKNWGGLLIKGMIAGFDSSDLIEESNMASIISEIMHMSEEGTEESIQEALDRIANVLEGEITPEVTIPVTTDNEKFITLIQNILDTHGAFKVTLEPIIPTITTTTVSSPAHAGGTHNGTVAYNQKALVNELGQEGLIRNNTLTLIPGGMHMEDLQRGDVILNHQQVEELKQKGKASGKAKVVGGENALRSYAFGTGTHAYAGTTVNARGALAGISNTTNAPADFSHNYWQDEWNKTLNTVVDNIPRYLNQLSREVNKLNNNINSFSNATDKREALQDKLSLVQKQIAAQNIAAAKYMQKANEVANKTQYQDENGNIVTLQSLASLVDLEALRNGSLTIEEASSSIQDQRQLEWIQQYQDWVDKAYSAQDESDNLVAALHDVYKGLVDLPFEELSKNIDKLSSTIAANESFANAASSGETGVALLNQMLHEFYGAEASNLFDPTGKSYEVLNKQLHKNIELRKEEVRQNMEALNEAKIEYNNLLTEQSVLNQKLKEAKQNIINTLQLTPEDYQTILNNKILDADSILNYAGSEETLNAYNDLVTRSKVLGETIKETGDEIDNTTQDNLAKIGELVQSTISMVDQGLQAIDKYWSAIQGSVSVYNDGLAASADYLSKWFKLTSSSSALISNYNQQIANYVEEANILRQNISAKWAYLNSSELLPGSTEYLEKANEIKAMENQLIELDNKRLELRKAQIDIPNELVQEKLGDIAAAYNEVTKAMEKNVAQSYTTMEAYNKLAGTYGGKLFNLDYRSPEFMYQNMLEASDLAKSREEAQVAIQGYQEALANYQAGGPAEEFKMREEALRTATEVMNEKVAEVAVKVAQFYENQIQNIQNYYNNNIALIETEINRLEKRNELLEQSNNIIGHAKEISSNYIEIIEDIYGRNEELGYSLNYMKQVLANGLASGEIKEFDQTWVGLTTTIRNTENELNSLGNEALATYQKMIQLPEKQMTEALDRLEKKFKGFTAVVSNSIATVNQRLNLSALNEDIRAEFGDIGQFEIDLSPESFIQGIELVDKNIEKEKEKLEITKQRLRDAIDTRFKLEGDGMTTPEAMAEAKQAEEDARKDVLNQAGVVAALQAKSAEDKSKTIIDYFDNIVQVTDAEINALNSAREYWHTYAADPFSTKTSVERHSIEHEMDLNLENYETYNEELKRLNDERILAILNGAERDSEEIRNLSAQIMGIEQKARTSYHNVRVLVEEMLEIPAKKYEEALANVARQYATTSAKLQTAMYSSLSQLKASGYGAYDFEDKSFQKYMRYDAQNAILAQDTLRAQAEAQEAMKYREETEKEYNRIKDDERYTSEERIKAMRKFQEADKEAITKMGEAGAATINNFKQMTENISSYFNTVNSNIDASINKVQTLNNILRESSSIFQGNYATIQKNDATLIAENVEKYKNTLQNAANEQAYLDAAVKKGIIVKGDVPWIEETTKIENMKNEAENLRSTTLQLFKSFLEMPTEVLSNNLDRIASKFASLNSIMSNGITESDTAMYYRNMANQTLSEDKRYTLNTSAPSFVARNQLISDNLKQQTDITAETKRAMLRAKANYEQVKANRKSTQAEINLAKSIADKLEQQYNNEQDKLLSDAAAAPMKFLENIKSFYDVEVGYLESLNNKLSTTRAYIADFIGYLGKMSNKQLAATEIVHSYVDEMSNYTEQIVDNQAALAAMSAQLDYDFTNGNITGQDYKKAKQVLIDLETQLISTKQKQMELFKEMVRVPTNVVDAEVDKIIKKYNMFDKALSAGLFNTDRGTELYKKAAAMFDRLLGGSRSSIMPDITHTINKSISSGLTNIIDIPEIEIETDGAIIDIDDILIGEKVAFEDLFEEELIDGSAAELLAETFETTFEESLDGIYFPATTPNLEPDLYPEYVVTDERIKGIASNITLPYEKQNEALNVNLEKLKEIAIWRGQNAVVQEKIRQAVEASTTATEEEKKAAKDAAEEATQAAEDAMIEYLKSAEGAFSEMVTNMKSSFDLIDSWFSTLNNKMKSIREYATDVFGHLNQASLIGNMFDQEIENNETLMAAYKNEAEEIRRAIDYGLENGKFTKGDKEYLELAMQLPELTNKYVSAASDNMSKFRAKYDEANQIVAEDIERMLKGFQPLDVVMRNMDTLGSQRKLSALGYDYAFRNNNITNPDATGFAYDKTYIGQNLALELDTERERLNLESFHEAVMSTSMALDAARANVDLTEEKVIAAEEAHSKALENFNNELGEYNTKWVTNTMQAVENVNSYYNNLANHYDTVANHAESARKMIDRFGRTLTTSGRLTVNTSNITKTYTDQVENLELKQKMLTQSIAYQQIKMEKIGQELGTDSEEYLKLADSVMELKDKLNDTEIQIDDVWDALRQEIYFKPIDDEIERIESLKTAFSALTDLIPQESMITDKGEYTQYGKLAIGLAASQREAASAELDELTKKYRLTYELWEPEGSYQDSELLRDLNTLRGQMQNTVKEYQSSTFSMMDIAKNRFQEHINYLKKLIDAQKEELQKQKEMADYDKSLKKKNNSVLQLEAQIRALENLDDLESKARRTRLEEQLHDAREDVNDTIEAHIVQMQQEGLDKVAEKLDKGFESYVKDIAVNMLKQDEMADTMKISVDMLNDEINESMNGILRVYGQGISSNMMNGFNNLTPQFKDLVDTDLATRVALTEKTDDQNAKLQLMIDNSTKSINEEEAKWEGQKDAKLSIYQQDQTTRDTDRNTYLSGILAVDAANALVEADISATLATLVERIGGADMSLSETITTDIDDLEKEIKSFLNNPTNQLNKTMTDTINGVQTAIENETKEGATIPNKIENVVTEIQSLGTTIEYLFGVTAKSSDESADDSNVIRHTTLDNILDTLNEMKTAQKNTKAEPIDEKVSNPDTPTAKKPNDNTKETYKADTGRFERVSKYNASVDANGEHLYLELTNEDIKNGYLEINGIRFQIPPVGGVSTGTQRTGTTEPKKKTTTTSKKTVTAPEPAKKTYSSGNPNIADPEPFVPNKTSGSVTNNTLPVNIKKNGVYTVTRKNGTERILTDADFKAGHVYIDGIDYILPQKYSLDYGSVLKARGYASGTTSARAGIARVNERGPEAFVLGNSVYMPFRGGEGVIPAKETQAILQLAKMLQNSTLDGMVGDGVTARNYKQIMTYLNQIRGGLYDYNNAQDMLADIVNRIDGGITNLESRIYPEIIDSNAQQMMNQDRINHSIEDLNKAYQMMQTTLVERQEELESLMRSGNEITLEQEMELRAQIYDITSYMTELEAQQREAAMSQYEQALDEYMLQVSILDTNRQYQEAALQEYERARDEYMMQISILNENRRQLDALLSDTSIIRDSVIPIQEDIIRESDVIQLGDAVLEPIRDNQDFLTDALNDFKREIVNGMVPLQMPDLSNYEIPEYAGAITNNNDVHFDSLITINGNADASTVYEIKKIAKDLVTNKSFIENMTNQISQKQSKDRRMAGKRVTIK